MIKPNAVIAITIVTAAILGGCASPPQQSSAQGYPQQVSSPAYPASSSYTSNYGVVDAIHVVRGTQAASGIGIGAVVGGVVGGLLGNQVGGGSGKQVATAAGVVGGAVVGHQIEQSNQAPAPDAYQIRVRLDNNSYQTIQQDSIGELRIGSRARIENGRVYRY